ncbi:MAG: CopG family transcriptional regulator [candidate division KSB1 bacterium]|nr:CopG family transcriptional regulator [candidate division KSB1 bacterium]MDZ7342852.1 CopG family transcriptional regulator [candidate division KSB1 bacterium]
MATAKTTLSIQKTLYDMLSQIALELKLPNHTILELAVSEFIKNYKYNQELLDRINEAYNDLPDQDEQYLLSRMRTRQKNIVEGQW